MDDAQYDYFLSLVNRRPTPQLFTQNEPSKNENKAQDEEAIMLQSKVSQVKDLFPDFGDGFVALCLEAYDNDPEKVISRILENTLHPDLDSLDRNLASKPSKNVEPSRDKGKGKAIEEPRVDLKGKGVIGHDSGGSSVRLPSSAIEGSAATSVGREGTSNARQPSASASGAPEDVSKSQAANVNQGRFVRRGKPDGSTFNQLMDRRENMSYSATVRAGKQYEYEDEYDDSFDDLAASYVGDVGKEEETENLADKTRRHSAPGNSTDEALDRRSGGKASHMKSGSHQVALGADQSVDRRQNRQHHDTPKASGPAGSNPQEFNPSGYGGRTGQPSGRGGHHQSTGPFTQARKPSYGGAPEANSSARVGPAPPAPPAPSEETISTSAGAPPSQGGSAATRGGKSQRGKGKGKGKVDPTANFYLKDGKLYSYKVISSTTTTYYS